LNQRGLPGKEKRGSIKSKRLHERISQNHQRDYWREEEKEKKRKESRPKECTICSQRLGLRNNVNDRKKKNSFEVKKEKRKKGIGAPPGGERDKTKNERVKTGPSVFIGEHASAAGHPCQGCKWEG